MATSRYQVTAVRSTLLPYSFDHFAELVSSPFGIKLPSSCRHLWLCGEDQHRKPVAQFLPDSLIASLSLRSP